MLFFSLFKLVFKVLCKLLLRRKSCTMKIPPKIHILELLKTDLSQKLLKVSQSLSLVLYYFNSFEVLKVTSATKQ